MKDIVDLLPRVLENAAACPEPTAVRHLRDAAREFCRRTRIWRSTETIVFTAASLIDEPAAVEAGTELYEITHARFSDADGNASDLEAKTIDALDKDEPGWRDLAGTPTIITQSGPNTVRLVPQPTTGTLTLECVLLPALDADELPDILIDTYGKEIASGALGTILLLPNEDFGDAERAVVHATMFDNALGRWGDRIPRGQHRAKRRTKPSSFF